MDMDMVYISLEAFKALSSALFVCSGGFYCPNITTQLECPEGYYCKPQSIAPLKCGILTSCPARTTVPKWSGLAFVSAAIVSQDLRS